MTIEERLLKLERENRTWRTMSVGVLLLLGTVVSCSESTPQKGVASAAANAGSGDNEVVDVIRAKRIEATSITLKDDALQKSTVFGPGGIMIEKDGKVCVWLLSGKQGGDFQIFGANGPSLSEDTATTKPAPVHIGTSETGGGTISICNLLGKQVASLQSNKGNEGALYLSDVNGKIGNAFGP